MCCRLSPSFAMLVFHMASPGALLAQEPCGVFRRADANADSAVDLSDGITTLIFLFAGARPPPCLDAADSNDSGDIDVSDAIFTFAFLFAGGSPPPTPGPDLCGDDPSLDATTCLEPGPCLAECSCEEGATRPCGSAVGECVAGVQTCVEGRWGTCEGASGPTAELCDGLDNNCDGVADDPFLAAGAPCDGPDEDLCVTGVLACSADGRGLECVETLPGMEEVCDGADNDCDGATDEGFDADRDGWTTCRGDCDDTSALVNPDKRLDPVDGLDNDCDGATDEDVITTSHERDIQPIWTASCVSAFCHDSQAPAGRLSLQAGVAYDRIVDRPSFDAPQLDLIEPFEPERSYIWHKLLGSQLQVGGAGLRMPRGGLPLPQRDLDTIERWIREGAPR